MGSQAAQTPTTNRTLGLAGWLMPSMADVLFLALLGFALTAKGHQFINSDGDLARHLAVGREILAGGSVPLVDLFSYTKAGQPFVPYEWLSETIFGLAFNLSGLSTVLALAAVLAALPFLMLTRWMMREGSNPFIVVALVVVGALAASMHWLARPHLITILFALFWARSLERHRDTGSLRYLLPLPPLMALWANLHGGFLVGFVLLAIYLFATIVESMRTGNGWRGVLAGENHRTKELLATGLASLLAAGANPSGFGILPHVTGYFRSRFMVDNTVEYLSPNFHDLGPQLFLLLVLAGFLSVALNARQVNLVHLLLFCVWIGLSLYSARNIPLFVVICLPILGRWLSDSLHGEAGVQPIGPGFAWRVTAMESHFGRPLLPALAMGLAVLLFGGALGAKPQVAFDRSVFPVQALGEAQNFGIDGNVFNYFPWGGYMLYAAYPRYRVFIDGQTDFYGEQLMRDYLRVEGLEPGWPEVLDRYGVDWILFPHLSPLTQFLARDPSWRVIYQDTTADILVRSDKR